MRVMLILTLLLPLQPSLQDQCMDPSYAHLHPTVCEGYGGNGFGAGGDSPQSGGGGGRGLIGGILHGLGL